MKNKRINVCEVYGLKIICPVCGIIYSAEEWDEMRQDHYAGHDKRGNAFCLSGILCLLCHELLTIDDKHAVPSNDQ